MESLLQQCFSNGDGKLQDILQWNAQDCDKIFEKAYKSLLGFSDEDKDDIVNWSTQQCMLNWLKSNSGMIAVVSCLWYIDLDWLNKYLFLRDVVIAMLLCYCANIAS